MADVVSVSFSANMGNLDSALAAAQARVRAFGSQVRQLADQAANGNIGGNIADQLETASGALSAAKAEVSDLNAKLKEASVGGLERFNAGIKSAVEPLTLLSSRMRQTAEIAGITFAVDKVVEYAKRMGELGEKTMSMAAAVGISPHEFSALQGALTVTGGDADRAGAIIMRLGRNLQTALIQPSSQAARAVASLGISHEQLAHAARDTSFAMDLLAEKFGDIEDSETKAADYTAILGRGWQSLIPALRNGAAGLAAAKEEAERLGIVLSDKEITALANTNEKMIRLDQTIRGEGIRAFIDLEGAIDGAADAMQSGFGPSVDFIVREIKGLETAAIDLGAIWQGLKVTAQTSWDEIVEIFSSARKKLQAIVTLQWSKLEELSKEHNIRMRGIAAAGAEEQIQIAQQEAAILAKIWNIPWGPSGADGRRPEGSPFGVAPEKPTAAPWTPTTRGGAGSRSRSGGAGSATRDDHAAEEQARKEAEVFAAGERLKIQEAKGAAAQIQAIYSQWLAEIASLYGKDSTQYLDLEREKVAAAQRAAAEQVRAAQEAERKQEELDAKAARAAQRAAEAQAKPFVTAFDQIGSKFEDTITGLIDHTTTWQKAFKSIADQVLKDFIGMAGKMVSGAAGSALGGALGMSGGGSGGGGGGGGAGSNLSLGGVLGSLAGGLFGKIGGGAGSSILGGLGGLFGGSGNQDFSGAVGGAASGGGLFSFLGPILGGIGSIFGFARGGIVPSAAGGWSVPSLGTGGTLANLHSNEMVLPANISQGLQGAINGGSLGGGGGGGVTNHNYNISAVDASSVAKLFSNNGSALVAAINRATRNGSALSTG